MTIETDRLRLRAVTEADYEAFLAIVSNPNVALPAGFQPVKNSFEGHFLIRQTLHQRWLWGIVVKSTNQFIGTVGLYGKTDDEGRLLHDQRDLGYMLNESEWGHGYMSEAVVAVLNEAFQRGLTQIWGSYFEDNQRSAHIFKKMGFVFDHQLQHREHDFFAPGKQECFYRLNATDFYRANPKGDS